MRPSLVRRSTAAAAIVPLLALTTTACGGGEEDGKSDEPTTSESSTASAGGPAPSPKSSTGDGEANAPTDDGVVLPSGEEIDPAAFADAVRGGEETVTTAQVDFVFHIGGDRGIGEGLLDLTGDRDALQLDLTDRDLGGRARFYMIDGTVLRKDDVTSDDKFVQLDPEQTQGLSIYALFHVYQLNDLLLDGMLEVEHVGGETVSGTSAQHYRATIDPEALLAITAGFGEGEAPDGVEQQLWLDAEARLVKSRVEVSDDGETMLIETTLSDFGGPAPVEPPPASEIDHPGD